KEKRRQHVVDARSHGTGRAVLAAFAPTDETIVGLDLDQQAVALRKSRLGGIEGPLRNGRAKDVGRYSADDHRAIPQASASNEETAKRYPAALRCQRDSNATARNLSHSVSWSRGLGRAEPAGGTSEF